MYKRILVPIDGSGTSERGLQEALGLAKVHGATIHLLHLITEQPLYADMAPASALQNTVDSIRNKADGLVAAASQRCTDAGVQVDARVRPSGSKTVAEMIVDEAKDATCDLIVMGTHGRRGLTRLTMGSDAEGVVRRAPVPLLLVRAPDAK